MTNLTPAMVPRPINIRIHQVENGWWTFTVDYADGSPIEHPRAWSRQAAASVEASIVGAYLRRTGREVQIVHGGVL